MALAHIDAALHMHPETIVLMALAAAGIVALVYRAVARTLARTRG